MKSHASIVALLLSALCCIAGPVEEYAETIAPLIDPAKLATLKARTVNPRVRKYVYWLGMARTNRIDPNAVAKEAVKLAGYSGEAATVTTKMMMRNLDIATQLACFDEDGLKEMRKGNSPTIRRGPNYGQELSTDHIIPFAVCPELGNTIANLELMPLKKNGEKRDKIGDRQRALAVVLYKAGLLSVEGLKVVKESR